jgi:hypothetical protein
VLKSVGLTNEPNLPVFPLANSDPDRDIAADLDGGAIIGASVELVSQSNEPADFENSQSELGIGEAQNEAGSLNRQHIVAEVAPSFPQSLPTPPVRLLEREIEECRKEISLLNQRLINTILDAAIANARILPVERRHWNDALADNFDNASAQLATATPRLKMGTLTEGLRRTKLAESGEQKQRNIIALVHERMRSGGLSYHQAWMAITAERSDLF